VLQQGGYDLSRIRSQELNANYLPSENVRIPVDKDAVLKNGIVSEKDADKIVPYIDIKITGNALTKNRLLMLDIVANNNWERPIYFTGGAFGEDDYIWMKDYLQLEGLCYKLVPIRTAVDRANPFDMGRVDPEKMYSLVSNWQWGNSGSEDVYHDVESRKNGITYRGNLARLIEALINNNEPEKAEEIADLAMEKMPVEIFGYYTLLEPYISAYYQVDSKDKARKVFKDVSKKYQENLEYYSSLSIKNQQRMFEDIYTDIERYRGLVDVIIVNDDDEDFIKTEMEAFNNTLRLFRELIGDDSYEEPERTDNDIPKETSNPIGIENDSNN
jgi:tetratricopeptide (TPR) repeat protein